MARSRGNDAVDPSREPEKGEDEAAKDRKPRSRPSRGEASDETRSARPHGIAITWDPALRQMGELRVSEDAKWSSR
jgi:hypothetical protein